MENIKFGKHKKIFVDDDLFNPDTNLEYYELHFNYEGKDEDFIDKFGKELQENCDEKGYPVYVNIETVREIDTILVEIHNQKYRDNAHINEALQFIDDYVVKHLS